MTLSEQDKELIHSTLNLTAVPNAPIAEHVIELEYLFLSKLMTTESLRPKTDELTTKVLILAATEGYGAGYIDTIDRGNISDDTISKTDVPEVLSISWADAESLGYSLNSLDKASVRSAVLLSDMLGDENADAPIMYYGILGFLCGAADGMHELRNGAARYFAGRSHEDDEKTIEIVNRAVVKELHHFAETVCIITPESNEDLTSEEYEKLAGKIIAEIADSDKAFLYKTCDKPSNGTCVSTAALESWAELYAKHHILGFVEGLLGQEDKDSDFKEIFCMPKFDYDSTAALLVAGGCENIGQASRQAYRHMALTWLDNKKLHPIGAGDFYWVTCGVAYVEGLMLSQELMSKRDAVMITLKNIAPSDI